MCKHQYKRKHNGLQYIKTSKLSNNIIKQSQIEILECFKTNDVWYGFESRIFALALQEVSIGLGGLNLSSWVIVLPMYYFPLSLCIVWYLSDACSKRLICFMWIWAALNKILIIIQLVLKVVVSVCVFLFNCSKELHCVHYLQNDIIDWIVGNEWSALYADNVFEIYAHK